MTLLGSITSGIIVAIVTIALAGWRFQNEEQARQTREARDALRRMAASWSVTVGLFIESQRDLPMVVDENAEKYKMCSAVVETARALPWLTRRAIRRSCRILFGKEILALADQFPFDAMKDQSGFMLSAALFERGEPGEGGSRQIEQGHFGALLHNRRVAELDGNVALGIEIPRIVGKYRASGLLWVLSILQEARWYHGIVLSRPYQLAYAHAVAAVKQLRRLVRGV